MKKISTNPGAQKRAIIGLFYFLSVAGCQDDHELPSSIVQFSSKQQSVTEGAEATITLHLDPPAVRDGFITIKISSEAVYGKDYTTNPEVADGSIVLGVSKGAKSFELKINTIDNAIYEGDKPVNFSIVQLGDGLKWGKEPTITLFIIDDEGPSVASFAVDQGSVNEDNKEGIKIQIPFSTPTKGPGAMQINMALTKAIYGKDFVTVPAAENNVIKISVDENTSDTSIVILPIDDDLFVGDRIFSLTITKATGAIRQGQVTVFTLTIKDDELPSVVDFAAEAGSVDENNSEGLVVILPLSSPAKGEGSVKISFTSLNLVYGKDFTTDPPRALENNNYFSKQVIHNDDVVSFKVLPKDNHEFTGDRTIQFSISDVNGVLRKGIKLDYKLTIVEDELPPVVVNFAATNGSVDENNTTGFDIEIKLDPPARETGKITVTFSTNSIYGQDFTFDPVPQGNSIILDVEENQAAKTFKVLPVYKPDCTERSVDFTIASVSSSLKKGTKLNDKVKINDIDAAIASFSESEGSIMENNSAGKVVKINFSKPVIGNASLQLIASDGWAGYNSRFTTNPPAKLGEDCSWYCYYDLVLPIQENSVDTQFTVIPVNDNFKLSNYVLEFYLNDSSGCIKGASGSRYKLTIMDDD